MWQAAGCSRALALANGFAARRCRSISPSSSGFQRHPLRMVCEALERGDFVSIELGALSKLQTPVRLIIARGVEPLVNSAPLSWPSLQRSPASSYEILRCTHAVVVRMLDRQAFLGFIGFEVFAVAVRRITWSSLPRIFAGIAPRTLGIRKHRQAMILSFA